MKNTNPENGDSCAFPYVIPETDASFEVEPGLTKREFFAGLALAGLLSSAEHESIAASAHTAVLAADLLIDALSDSAAQ